MHRYLLIFIPLLLTITNLKAEKKEYAVSAIGFYNLENLFDTLDTPNVNDEEFTPEGSKLYNSKVYSEKLTNLSSVISELGTEMTPDGVAILGVSEIENRNVLEDLVKQKAIADRNYKIIHYDSPDKRGVDVGLLYQEKYFEPLFSKALEVPLLLKSGETKTTRDILWVYGIFDGEPMHIFVNHWPSRYGGQKASSYLRETAAAVAGNVIDSLLELNPQSKILLMGDLNDDPINESVAKVLGAKPLEKGYKNGDLVNPWTSLYKKGNGTLAWRDTWNLFDQIIISSELLNKESNSYFFYRAEVYNKQYMYQSSGRYKGYPFRTYSGGNYLGGYSDHFPVFIYLLKEVN